MPGTVEEPLTVRFANTLGRSRGEPTDAIDTTAGLQSWLAASGTGWAAGSVRPNQLARFVELRDAIRELLRTAADGDAFDPDPVEVLNRACAAVPRWAALVGSAGDYHIEEQARGGEVARALASIAGDAVTLLGTDARHAVRPCGAPDCVQFFTRDHPRREWCSTTCGNRVRAARHYQRHRAP
jgi:predicted RNA-binding Zn ribbon-like protein